MNKADLELYTDYLLSTFGYATATGLSRLVAGQVAHDQITRFLSAEEFTSKDLWASAYSPPSIASIGLAPDSVMGTPFT